MANTKVVTHFKSDSGTDFAERVRLNQQELIFDARFRRCYRLLHFIACRVLGGSERAEEAIGHAWRTASRHPQRFEHEGAFRGWLLRVLIDESLTLLRESVPTPTPRVLCERGPAPVFRINDLRDGKCDICTDDQDQLSQDFSVALE
jgi:DNA-directed RNA polymerase specialized sigma24 family protein